jgi:HEAT repeat protein
MTSRENHFRIRRRFPKTAKGRLLLALMFSVTVFLLAIIVIIGSVWIEDRYPSSDAKRALLPQAQQAVTKPIVNAISHQIERQVRRRAEAPLMFAGLTLEETIARFLDERVDLSQRRIYAYRLARANTPESIAALLKVFQTAPPEHKAFMAQLIGSTGNPAVKEWLWPLLNDSNEQVVAAAIRGLSAIGGEDVTRKISAMLADGQISERIRIEAALGLGNIGTSAARAALVETFNQSASPELAAQILNSLGRFEFSTVAECFGTYLEAPGVPPDMRTTAAEALANSSDDAVPFLMGLAANDSDAEVRASAAWAVSAHDTVHALGSELTGLVAQEPEADVRRRLYEALLPQNAIPAAELLPVVMAEQDVAARVAGFNALGCAVQQQPASASAGVFDREIVPELLKIATEPNSLNIQMRAVFALRRAQTPEAQGALWKISQSAPAPVASAAQNGLLVKKI